MAEQPKSAAELAKDKKRLTIRTLFEQQRPELAKLLPKGMTLERFERMALTECVRNPDLLDCTAESWALALQSCAAQGLYPDSALGYMYLIPRRKGKKQPGVQDLKEVHAQRGYQGDMKLWRNTGEVADIWAEVVHQRDEFKVIKGLVRSMVHIPYEGDDDPGPLRATYAVAEMKDGTKAWVVLFRRDVMRHKDAAAADTTKEDNPWVKHEEPMWKKTAIHELNKWMPKATEKAEQVAAAINTDTSAAASAVIDIEGKSVPVEGPPKGKLELVKERLAGEQAQAVTEATTTEEEPPAEPEPEAPAPKACEHVTLPKQRLELIPRSKTLACPDCGEEFHGLQREPGDDDEGAGKKQQRRFQE